MLRITAQLLSLGAFGASSVHNAVLESFALHARNLLHFLYPENEKKDDVLACDFFDDPDTWTNLRPDVSATLKEVRRKTNKQCAHVTYERIRLESQPERKGWKFGQIAVGIEQIIGMFIRNVPPDRLHRCWRTPEQLGGIAIGGNAQ